MLQSLLRDAVVKGHAKESMQIFAINLARRPDRRRRALEHLSERGLECHFVDGVDGSRFEGLPAGTLVNSGQFGCFASHLAVFNEFLQQTQDPTALILEDDVVLDASIDWPVFLKQLSDLMVRDSIDYCQLGYISCLYPSQWRVKLRWYPSGRQQVRTRRERALGMDLVWNSSLAGTHCYAVSRRFAEVVRHLNQPVWLPADGFFDRLAATSGVTGQLSMCRVKNSLAEQQDRLAGVHSIDSDVSR